MRFSNQRFFDIPHDEFLAQQEQLSELRDEHYRQLVELGTAERAIGSTALSNFKADKSPLSEGTLLYPFRRAIWNVSAMQSATLFADARLDRLFDDFGDPDKKNYTLYVGRSEPLRDNGYRSGGYAVGMVVEPETAAAIKRERYMLFAGMEEADLQLVEKQLSEVAAFAIEKGLEIIDPLTLSEGQGQVIDYDDDF
jgi:hypothetical protein